MTMLADSPAGTNGAAQTQLPARLDKLPIQMVEDNGQWSNLLDTNRFGHLQRVATLFSDSQLVPKHFQGNVANCFIALQMAMRMGVDPFMFMQNTYIVYGRPGMEAKLAIALINSSGLFTDSLDYEVEGDDPFADGYRVRAFATRKSTNKIMLGPWVDWKTVRAEGWFGKDGSKWKTIPGLMFQYRAATFFGRVYCPERLMGMQTVDEINDVEAIPVQSQVIDPSTPATKSSKLADELRGSASPSPVVVSVVEPAKPAKPAAAPTPTKEPQKEQTVDTVDEACPDFDSFKKNARALVGGAVSRSDFENGIKKFVLSLGKVGKENEIPQAQLVTLFKAIRDKNFNYMDGKILPPQEAAQ